MVALACNQSAPSGVAVHNGVVYWTNYEAGGSVMSVPATGGTPTVVASNQDYPWAIAVDDNNVYWTNYDNESAPDPGGSTMAGTLMQAPVAGGSPLTLDTALEEPWGIAIDATSVYYTTFGGGRVKRVPIGGGTVTVLASGQNQPTGLAVDGTSVYWANNGAGTIASVSKTTAGVPKILVTSANTDLPLGVAVSGSTLFFANYTSPGDIDSVALPGGGNPTALATGEMYPLGLTHDAKNLYWTSTMSGGYVASVPLAGGAVTQLATNLANPTGIAVDANGIYFAASVGGKVWWLSPP